jgi:hypothetical protein
MEYLVGNDVDVISDVLSDRIHNGVWIGDIVVR